MWTPYNSLNFREKISAGFWDIKFWKFSQNSTFLELGEFPAPEDFLFDGADVGHMWTKFQPDSSIPWGLIAIWSFGSHWP